MTSVTAHSHAWMMVVYTFYSLWWENKSWFWYDRNQFSGFASLSHHGQFSRD